MKSNHKKLYRAKQLV